MYHTYTSHTAGGLPTRREEKGARERARVNIGEKAPGGVEPSTFCLLDRRSNQLSYGADSGARRAAVYTADP